MVRDTRRERKERTLAKYKSGKEKVFTIAVFLFLFLLIIWVFIEAVKSQSVQPLIPALAVLLILVALMFHGRFYRDKKHGLLLLALIIIFLALTWGLVAAQGTGNIPAAIFLSIVLIIVFILIVGVSVFLLDLVFWEYT